MVGWKGWIVYTHELSLVLGYGRAVLYRCESCDKRYYTVQTLFTAPVNEVSRLEEILYVPRFYESNSKCHYVYPNVIEPVIVKKPRVLAKEVAEFQNVPKQKIVAEFVNDLPFQHVAVLVGEKWSRTIDYDWEKRDCNECYCKELMKEAQLRQGNLYFRKSDCPRVRSIHQPGVEEVSVVYNHRFVDGAFRNITVLAKELPYGILGSLEVVTEKIVVIRSPDHDDIELEPGTWEFFHPRPRESVD